MRNGDSAFCAGAGTYEGVEQEAVEGVGLGEHAVGSCRQLDVGDFKSMQLRHLAACRRESRIWKSAGVRRGRRERWERAGAAHLLVKTLLQEKEKDLPKIETLESQ